MRDNPTTQSLRGGPRGGPHRRCSSAVAAIVIVLALIGSACGGSEDSADRASGDTTAGIEQNSDTEQRSDSGGSATEERQGDRGATDSVEAPTPAATPTPIPTSAPPPRPVAADTGGSDTGGDDDPNGSDGAGAATGTEDPGSSRRPSASATAGATCASLGVDSFGDVQIEIAFASEHSTTSDLSVNFALTEDGVPIGDWTATIEFVVPGEAVRFSHDTLHAPADEAAVVDCEIRSVEPAEYFGQEVVELTGPACRVLGVDDFDDIQIEVTFVNGEIAMPDLDVFFALRAGGTRFDTAWISLARVAPGEAARLEVDTLTELPPNASIVDIECQVLGATTYDFGFDYDDPAPRTACEVVEVDSFGDVQIRATAPGPYPETVDAIMFWVMRGPANERIANDQYFVESVSPAGGPAIDIDTFTPVPRGLHETDLTCEVIGWQSY